MERKEEAEAPQQTPKYGLSKKGLNSIKCVYCYLYEASKSARG